MELYYKVVKVERHNDNVSTTYSRVFRSSEPLFARRAAIDDAEKMREELEGGNSDATILVSLCFAPIEGYVTELPVHTMQGNQDLTMLVHHSWALETSLYYQYKYETGGDLANHMGSTVLYDVLEQVKEDEL
ncbi:MAG: hypothetical protein EOP56_12940 [Sphingobacteriales bacterium]|nr:MAG: hypothetical protein EOP56_12940 [Sphingobacteriales bacterium]